MRRLTLLLISASLLSVLTLFNDFASAQSAGVSLFSETSYDFKGIPRNTEPRHSFVFTNTSKSDLKLVSARTSCQCTKVFIPEKRVFKPGEKGEVVAQIDGVRFTGVRRATVTPTFELNGRTFEIPLNVTGVVLENVRLTPQKMNFLVDEQANGAKAPVAKEATASRSQNATVLYPSMNDAVVRADCSDPRVSIKIGKPVRTNAGMQTPLVVSIKEDATAGYINTVVHLWSNGSYRATPLTLAISGVVRAPLTVSPPTLTFFTPKDKEVIVKNVVIAASSEFTIKSVTSESKAISCKFSQKQVRPAKVCVLPVSFDPSKLQDENSSTKIKVETTDGRALYVSARISSGNFEVAGLTQLDRDEPIGLAKATEPVDAEESEQKSGNDAPVATDADQVIDSQVDASIANTIANIPQTNSSALVPAQQKSPASANARRSRYPNASAQYPNRTREPQSMGSPLGGVARALFR